MIESDAYGFRKKCVPGGNSLSLVTCPDTTRSLTGGHLSRTRAASLMPSIDPDICEHYTDVGPRLKDEDCFIRIMGDQGFKAGIFDDLSGHHQKERFVFDDQNDLPRQMTLRLHAIVPPWVSKTDVKNCFL